MTQIHQATGVNEVARSVVVVPSLPFAHAQIQRATAAATIVPFKYASGRPGGP